MLAAPWNSKGVLVARMAPAIWKRSSGFSSMWSCGKTSRLILDGGVLVRDGGGGIVWLPLKWKASGNNSRDGVTAGLKRRHHPADIEKGPSGVSQLQERALIVSQSK